MYQGKYLPGSRKAPTDVQEPQAASSSAVPSETTPEPVRKPTPNAKPPKKQRRGPRPGGIIFYTLYFLFILGFIFAAHRGMQWLQGWLADYEAAQPTVKAEQAFNQLFADPKWDELYEAAGVQDSAYEGKEQFVIYMENKIGDAKLTYLETSAGLSGDKKYVVRLGNEKIASFTLVDQNNVGDASMDNLGKIPDWQLGSVEVFFERKCSYLIEKLDGHTAYVNGVPLDESHTIQILSTKAEEYLPEGTIGVGTCTQQITGLLTLPTVTVLDENGIQMEVLYDEFTCTFTEYTENSQISTISEEEEQAVLNAAKTYCLWMIKEVTSKTTLAKYFDSSSDIYRSIVKTTELWVQNHDGYQFTDISITEYRRYTDDLFSVRASMTLNVTRTNGSIRSYPYLQSLIFRKNDSGKWLCIAATNVDIYQPVCQVRLTFMQGGTQLATSLYRTDVTEIIAPAVSPVPEGQVFSGWATVAEDDSGSTVYTLVFQPDETGRIAIPAGTVLKPMTLYAVFEDAEAGSAAPAAETSEAGEGA